MGRSRRPSYLRESRSTRCTLAVSRVRPVTRRRSLHGTADSRLRDRSACMRERDGETRAGRAAGVAAWRRGDMSLCIARHVSVWCQRGFQEPRVKSWQLCAWCSCLAHYNLDPGPRASSDVKHHAGHSVQNCRRLVFLTLHTSGSTARRQQHTHARVSTPWCAMAGGREPVVAWRDRRVRVVQR